MHASRDVAASPLRDPTPRSEAATRVSPAPLPDHVGAVAPQWSLPQRLLFRYALLHALLYMAPLPLATLVQVLSRSCARLDELLHGTAPAPGEVAVDPSWLAATGTWLREHPLAWFGEVDTWWQAATSWAAANVFPAFDVIHQRTGSGDTAHDFVRLFLIVLGAALLTGIWSALDRRRIGYPRLGRVLHLVARWYLAYWMLVYGAIKLYSSQFGEPSMARLSGDVGDMSPMGMVWTFLGASKPYEVFGGIGEVLGGLLLLHRRTALLGCFVTIGVMANVCALNWLYDVPVKLFSTHLLVFAVALLAPWAGRLAALFVTNRTSTPVDLRVVHAAWLRWSLAAFGWLYAGALLVDMHQNNTAMAASRAGFNAKPELYGRWDVEKMLVDGAEVPVADATRWQFLAVDRGGRAFAREATGVQHAWSYAEDVAAGTVTLTPSGGGAEPGTWSVELGQKTVEVPHPEPRTMEDYRAMVPRERRTLLLKGTWGGKAVELHTVEHVFRLHRGFHWVQELPFNR